MTKHGRRLMIAAAFLGTVALAAAGPSLAFRIVSSVTTSHVATPTAMDDDDYVELLTRAIQTGQ